MCWLAWQLNSQGSVYAMPVGGRGGYAVGEAWAWKDTMFD